VQDYAARNIHASPGVAIREFPLKQGHGTADYMLYVDQQAVGVVEAKKVGETLSAVEVQTEKYATGVPDEVPAPRRPLPFQYQSTGVETYFTNLLDPEPRAREVFHVHRSATLAEWVGLRPGVAAAASSLPAAAESGAPYLSALRSRLRNLPPLNETGLWQAQVRAIQGLERSFAEDRPRALIQMATGTGKTFTAVTSVYRLIKFGGARRILFLVDRANLGRQALSEFQRYTTPDDGRKFTELYNVQHLTSNKIDPAARVVISTIQRLYSILQGEELDQEADERSAFEVGGFGAADPLRVVYNQAVPIEAFDVVVVDECHRSIYNLWRQVLDYFDSFLVGLTATPSKQTLGFFNQNLVMEYGHEEAVLDGVNVGGSVYRISTRITEGGSKVEAGHYVDRRNRETRTKRWEQLDEDFEYAGNQLDRDVVAMDQLRTVVQTFRDKLPTEIFPGRTEVPKTLIFAKDDSHADDVVRMVREEFGKGNAFAEKITYRSNTARVVTKEVGPDGQEVEKVTYVSTGIKPEDLISSFRNSYNPRIAVTVDMIATGTDIRPLEIVMFMRNVRSRLFFEQMKGRGVRTILSDDLQRVTPDARVKDRFVIVDCVGVCEQSLVDSPPLERNPSIPLQKLLDLVASGSTDVEVVSTLASRLARLDLHLSEQQQATVKELAGGKSVNDIASDIVDALDPDRQVEQARADEGLGTDEQPSEEAVAAVGRSLMIDALKPIAQSPNLRNELENARRQLEQTIDTVSKDEVLVAGYSPEAVERARSVVESFKRFVAANRDEITALQILYARPYRHGLRFADIRELTEKVQAPPNLLQPETVWRAYETLDRTKVRGSGYRTLTDLVSLVRHVMNPDGDLVPFSDQVLERFGQWFEQQQSDGRSFTDEQLRWLELIRDEIAGSVAIDVSAFDYAPFNALGGVGKAHQVFGSDLGALLGDLNEALTT